MGGRREDAATKPTAPARPPCRSSPVAAGLTAFALTAYPPKTTLARDRFMAAHMMYERMPPDAPMSAPTLVSRSLPSRKPSAQSA